MKNHLREKFNQIIQCFCLIILSACVRLANVDASPVRSPNVNSNNSFKRPGTPLLLDETAQGDTVGSNYGSDIAWVKSSSSEPSGGQRNYGGNGHGHQFAYTLQPGGGDVIELYKKNLGVYYQSNADKTNAVSTTVHFRYYVEISNFEIGIYRPPLTIVQPASYGKIEIYATDGGPSYSITAQAAVDAPSSPTVSLGDGGPSVSFEIPTAAREGARLRDAYQDYPDITKSLGTHTAKSPFKYYVTVSSRGQITTSGNGLVGKAWGRIAWNFYIISDYGNGMSKQIPYKFPPPKHGSTLIGFYK